jgi:hypothetical protein
MNRNGLWWRDLYPGNWRFFVAVVGRGVIYANHARGSNPESELAARLPAAGALSRLIPLLSYLEQPDAKPSEAALCAVALDTLSEEKVTTHPRFDGKLINEFASRRQLRFP